MTDYAYVGNELDLFADATNWKSYFRSHLDPYLGSEVLEVGAGLGGTTRLLCRGRQRRWVCLEPDRELADRLARSIRDGKLPPQCEVVVGTLEHITGQAPFDGMSLLDTIVKINQSEPVRPKKFQLAIPDMFESVVLKMLAKKAEDRYQTAAVLQGEFERREPLE